MMLNFNACVSAFVVSFSQLLFSDRALSGLFVWLGLFFLYPWNALGSIVAVLIAIIVHRLLHIYTLEQQLAGWSGFNAAIVGLFWGGGIADSSANFLYLLIAVAVTILLELLLGRMLRRMHLPILSSPAMITIVLFSLLLANTGEWYWVTVVAQYWNGYDQYIGIVCLIIAMSIMNFTATGWSLAFSALVYLSLELTEFEVYNHVGLWALNIPLSIFAVLAVFYNTTIHKSVAVVTATFIVSIIWILWHVTNLNDYIQPIVIPMIISLWVTIYILRKYQSSDYLSTYFWNCAEEIRSALKNREAVFLLYVANKDTRGPLEQLLKQTEITNSPLLDSELWSLGKRMKLTSHCKLVDKLLRHVRYMFFEGIYTLAHCTARDDVDASKILNINEPADVTTCINCGTCKPWPEVDVWKYAPLACEVCLQPLVPGSLISWFSQMYKEKKLRNLFNRPSLVLILGAKSDPLVKNILANLNEFNNVKIRFLLNGNDIEEGVRDQNAADKIIFQRIINLSMYLRIFTSNKNNRVVVS